MGIGSGSRRGSPEDSVPAGLITSSQLGGEATRSSSKSCRNRPKKAIWFWAPKRENGPEKSIWFSSKADIPGRYEWGKIVDMNRHPYMNRSSGCGDKQTSSHWAEKKRVFSDWFASNLGFFVLCGFSGLRSVMESHTRPHSHSFHFTPILSIRFNISSMGDSVYTFSLVDLLEGSVEHTRPRSISNKFAI